MDLLEQTIKHLMSERERKSWQLQEHQKETVLIIKFKPERRHFDSDDSEGTELQTDFKPSRVTYKRKSQYQIKRDFNRSVGLVQKYDGIRSDSKKSDSQQHNSPSGDLDSPGVTPPASVTEHAYCKPTVSTVSTENPVSKNKSAPSPKSDVRKSIENVKQSHMPSKPDHKPPRSLSPSPAEIRTFQAIQDLNRELDRKIQAENEAQMKMDRNRKMIDCFYCRDKLPPDPSEVWYEDSGGVRRQFCANLCKQMFETDNKA